MTRLRLASYNIRKAVGLDWRRDPARVLSVVNTISADVVVLQEADLRLGPRPAAIPRALVARETDYEIVDLAQNAVSLGWHGNAILVRRGIAVTRARRLELPGLEPRGAVMATVAGLTVVGTHLGLMRRWRLRQMHCILEHLEGRIETAIVAGDFNEWSDNRGYEPFAGDCTMVFPGPTFHASRAVAALDGFACGARVRVHRHGVERGGAARIASDHLPVWAEVEADQHSVGRKADPPSGPAD